MKKLSIVGKDYHTEEHVIGFYNTGDRMKFWGKRGAFWGGFWAMLFGSAPLPHPRLRARHGLGPLVGLDRRRPRRGRGGRGPDARSGAGLYSIGIPKDSVLQVRDGAQGRSLRRRRARHASTRWPRRSGFSKATNPLSVDEHHASAANDGEFRQQGATVGSP